MFMTYLEHLSEEASSYEDKKVFKHRWSERSWRHLMKLYRYMNRARGLRSTQNKDSRSSFVPRRARRSL